MSYVGYAGRVRHLEELATRLAAGEDCIAERDEAVRAAVDESVALIVVQGLTGLTMDEIRDVQFARRSSRRSAP